MPRAKAGSKKNWPKLCCVLYYHLGKYFGSQRWISGHISPVPQGHSLPLPALFLTLCKYLAIARGNVLMLIATLPDIATVLDKMDLSLGDHNAWAEWKLEQVEGRKQITCGVWMGLLISYGTEMTFFIIAGMLLCFRISVTHQYFSFCRAVLTLGQGLFCFSCCPDSEEAAGAEDVWSGYSQDS